MGQRGPAKLPTETLKRRGSWQAKVREKEEPTYEDGKPACPVFVKGYGKRMWNKYVEMFMRAGVLTEVDGAAFARYCAMWQEYFTLAQTNIDDIDVSSTDGIKVLLSLSRQKRELHQDMLRVEKEYGMTPASRPNVKVDNANKKKTESKTPTRGTVKELRRA